MVSSELLSTRLSPSQVGAKQYGVTKPISTAGPTEVDIQRTSELEKYLVDAGLYESNEEAAKREEVLQRIGQVHAPDSDVDTLCVGPSYVNCEVEIMISTLCDVIAVILYIGT
ncbi:hypothetical protein FNV43_RR15255 [Rhamnella rubrinervis]|uniref:Poly(A) polymerase nucleotidyltransferase domain-containing protein n=1 Tax=Rhamnella rubrinervis TaxID=2594499 RepID=A0A8K0GX17_9ROSA|nr:hypothetical protein FNV43_RR15255 [Rhamnella rubrinervis]